MKRTYKIAKRLTVTFDWVDDRLEVSWNPGMPDGNTTIQKRYRAARDAYLAELSEKLGKGPIVVVEV